MKRALLIDLDGVIRLWDRPSEDTLGLPPDVLFAHAFAPERLTRAVCGEVEDAVWRREIVDALTSDYGRAGAEHAVGAWSAPCGRVDERVLVITRELRAGGASVALVTNATTRLAVDLDALGLTAAFDAVINSAEVGAAKPSARIYEAALDALGASAGVGCFVDDRLENVAAAISLGLDGFHYRGDSVALRSWVAARFDLP